MQSLKTLPIEKFENLFKQKISEERKITVEVLHYFREVERRMLYAKRGYSSLVKYAVEVLKYSGGAANRRVSAMHLMFDVPEVEGKILSGDLSLSVLAQIATGLNKRDRLRRRKSTVDEKRAVIREFENLSVREADRKLAELFPEAFATPKETIRAARDGLFRLQTTIDQETFDMLDETQDLMGRKLEVRELLKIMLADNLIKLRKKRGVRTEARDKQQTTKDQPTKEQSTKDQPTTKGQRTTEQPQTARHADTAATNDANNRQDLRNTSSAKPGGCLDDDWQLDFNFETTSTNRAADPNKDDFEKQDFSQNTATDEKTKQNFDETDDRSEPAHEQSVLMVGADQARQILEDEDEKIRRRIFSGRDHATSINAGGLVETAHDQSATQQFDVPSTTPKKTYEKTDEKATSNKRTYISVHVDRASYFRAGGRCEYVDPVSGMRCSETRYLHREHVIPVAHGGTNAPENMQWLCPSHNRLRAVEVFGRDKMKSYVHSLR